MASVTNVMPHLPRLPAALFGILIALAVPIAADNAGVNVFGRADSMVQEGTSPGFTDLRLSVDAIAGRSADAELTFTTPVKLPEGTIITLHQHWMDESRLQNDDPGHAAYVAASAATDFLPVTVEVPGVLGGLGSLASVPGFRVGAMGLPAGSRVRLQVTQFTLPKVAGHEFSLPVHVRLPGQARRRVPGNTLRITPDEFSRISVTARSLVASNEDVNLRVRMEDQFGNLVEDRRLSLDLRVNGVFRQRAELDRALDGVPGVSFDLPGVYQVELRTGGGGIRAVSNPIRVGHHERDILWLDFGATSGLSTGYLDPSALVDRGAGYFDLVLPADHESYLAGAAGFTVDRVAIFRLGESDSVVRLIGHSGAMVDVAQPELTTDLRRFTRETLRLAQVVAGPGHHLWLGRRLADRGYRIGFVGSNYSRQFTRKHAMVHTAVLVGTDDWFEAMQQGRTYVSIGERIVILPGDPDLEMNDTRFVNFQVVAGGPIESVTLFKNGEPIEIRRGPKLENDSYRLTLSSDSHPFSPILSLPRNAREWVGYISTRNASLSVTQADDWRLDARAGGQRIDFLTRTHGTMNQITVQFDAVAPDTVPEIGIASGFEDAAWLPSDRLPQPTLMQRFLIPLSEVKTEAGASRFMEVSGYSDRLQLLPARAPLAEGQEYEFRYRDSSTPRRGDYYFLMVRQQNGAMAYSSPVFVGL